MSDLPVELAGYRVEQELGEGGIARVYRAYDPRFDRYVALKILKASKLADPAVVARFLDEARNAGPLSHLNIVRFIGSTPSRNRSSTWSWSRGPRWTAGSPSMVVGSLGRRRCGLRATSCQGIRPP